MTYLCMEQIQHVLCDRGLDLCWRDLLSSQTSAIVDDTVVVQDWLMKHPIVLLQRGFAHLAFTCLSNYLSSNGLALVLLFNLLAVTMPDILCRFFNLDHWHSVIAEMIMSPLSFVLGQVTSPHTLKTSEV